MKHFSRKEINGRDTIVYTPDYNNTVITIDVEEFRNGKRLFPMTNCYDSRNTTLDSNEIYVIKEMVGTKENPTEPEYPVSDTDKEEFIGQIIDSFQDFLDSENPFASNAEYCISGKHYDRLSKNLEKMMNNWNILDGGNDEN